MARTGVDYLVRIWTAALVPRSPLPCAPVDVDIPGGSLQTRQILGFVLKLSFKYNPTLPKCTLWTEILETLL